MTSNPWEEINEGRNTLVEGFRGTDRPIFADDTSTHFGGTLTKNPQWRPTLDDPVPRVRCQYMKRDGNQCSHFAIAGSGNDPTDKILCRYHGGTLPNVAAKAERVRAAAADAILDYVGTAIDHIGKTITDESVPDNVRLAAAKDMLDRANIKGATEVNVTVQDRRSPAEILSEQIRQMRGGEEPLAELESADAILDEEEEH